MKKLLLIGDRELTIHERASLEAKMGPLETERLDIVNPKVVARALETTAKERFEKADAYIVLGSDRELYAEVAGRSEGKPTITPGYKIESHRVRFDSWRSVPGGELFAKKLPDAREAIFVVPSNDLESVEIRKMLRENGVPENNILVTGQQWGASWDGLEKGLKMDLYGMVKENPDLKVYGVELKGEFPSWLTGKAANIDHHSYEGEDRSNPASSIEQTAALLGVPMTEWQKYVAANDKGFVLGVMDLAAKDGKTLEQATEIVRDVRSADHAIIAKSQGITSSMEKEAEEAIKDGKEACKWKQCLTVHLDTHSKCTTVTDRVPLQEYQGGLLIVCKDGKGSEIDYYGPVEKCMELKAFFSVNSLAKYIGSSEKDGFTNFRISDPDSHSLLQYTEDLEKIANNDPREMDIGEEFGFDNSVKEDVEISDAGDDAR